MLNLLYKLYEIVNNDSIFWFCALLGSGLFIIQFSLNLFGGDSHDDIDDGAGEIDSGKFKWLSKQGLTGFLMMFGFVGLTCRNEFELSGLSSIMISFAGGLTAIFITGLIFRGASKLRSSGTVFRIEDTIGKEATIYQRIPKNGIGKISVSLNNFTHEIDAMTNYTEDLPSFTHVQIIKKADDNTVLVIPIK
jgi:hypothetical protein